MAVVAALDLDDEVATGDRAHQVHGVHRRLGAGVAEAPQREPEPAAEFGRDPDRVLGGLREVRAAPHPVRHRRDDRRVGVTGDRRAVAAVHVDVLGAVDVVHLGARAVAHPHRLRLGDLPARRRPAGEVLLGPRDQLRAARLARQEHALLVLDQLVQAVARWVCGRLNQLA